MRSIASLIEGNYGRVEQAHCEFLRWQYEMNPAGPPRIWLAKDQRKKSRLAGQYAVIPMRVKVGSAECLGSLSLLTLTDSDYRNQGIFTRLAELTYDDCRNDGISFTYGFPNPNSYPGFTRRLGFEDIGSVPFLIKPVDPDRLWRWKLGNRFVGRIMTAISRALLPTLFPECNPTPSQELVLTGVERFDRRFDALWTAIGQKRRVMVIRDANYLNWRYGHVPLRNYKVFQARNGDDIVGYVVCRCAEYEQVEVGVIIDFVVASSDRGREAGRLLVAAAEEYFRDQRMALVSCLMLPHTDEYRILRQLGYVRCPRRFEPQPFVVIVRAHSDDAPTRLLHDLDHWFLTFGDYDVF